MPDAAIAPAADRSPDLVRNLLARWHVAPAEPDDGNARRLLTDGFAPRDRSRERQALLALRRRLDALPLGRIHPSWVARAIPDDALLRLWCLDALPQAERAHVLRELPPLSRPAVLNAAPPPWFGGWWARRLRTVVDYPWALEENLDPAAPFSFLDRLLARDLLRLLRVFGLRALAAAVKELDSQVVVALAVALPAVARDRLAAHSRAGRHGSSAAWAAVLRRLQDAELPAGDHALALAIEDVAAQAATLGETAAARRIAYRLPARWGSRLLERLAGGAGDLVHPHPEQWQRDLVTDLGHLVRGGAIRPLTRLQGIST